MKKYYFSLILMTAIFAELITSCDKDDTAVGMTVSGNLEFSERYKDKITKVEIIIPGDRFSGSQSVILARCAYSNGTFSLELPARVDDKYLGKYLPINDLPSNYTVSDKMLKAGVFNFTATDFDETNNVQVDTGTGIGVNISHLSTVYLLVFAKSDEQSITEAMFLYADRNCSIIGSMTVSDEESSEFGTETFMVEKTLSYFMHLKRGWNIVYHTETQYMETSDKQIRIDELSTEPVSGMKWYVREDFY